MNKKKLCITLLSMSLIVSLLSGCKGKDRITDAETADGKPKTFTMFVNGSDFKPIQISETPVGKKVTEITGVTLKMDYLVGSDEKTKAGVMVAGGEYPDLLNPHNEFATFRDAGALVPLDEMIEKYGDNIKKAYGKDLNKLRDPDGHIYSLSPARVGNTPIYPFSGWYLPKDVLKSLGYPKITNIDEYFKVIEDYVKANPTVNGKSVIGFTAETDGWRNYVLTNAPAYLAGYPNTGNQIISQKDGKYVAENFYLSKYAHDYFSKLNEMWNKGLVDKEMFTQNKDAYDAKMASGRVIGFYDERWQIQNPIDSLTQQKLEDKTPIALPVTFSGVNKNSYNGISVTAIQAGICITKSCKDPVAAFKFLDAMASEEVQKLVNWGIEGEDYTVKDGKMVLEAKHLEHMNDPEYGVKQGVGMFWQFPHPNFGKNSKYSDGNFVSPSDTEEYINSKYKPYEKEVAQAYGVKNLAEMVAPPFESPFGYGWDITIPESEQEIKLAQQKSGDIARTYSAKLVMAQKGEFENIWNQYCKEMKDAKYNIGDAYITKVIQQRVADWSK